MTSTIDVAFIEEYNADVHMKYRQMGSRLQAMTRKGTIQAKSVTFQVFGALVAQGKTRNAEHTFLDPAQTKVTATMADYYVPTLVDDLDLLKLNIDEKRAHAGAHVAALAKKTDDVLKAAMEAGANSTDLGDASAIWDYDTAMDIVTTFTENEVPDDGNRFCALHPRAWKQFLKVPEFANADYVGQEQLPFSGSMTAKFWMGTLWMPMANITRNGTSGVSTNLAWHRSSVGHGVNKEISTNWDYENTRSAWSCVSSMSLGACVVEDTGIYKVSTLS
tara:strand:- start:61 stop:888 length:828 start_codon:yes stop_codon:yes gene_type:complete